jgi:hypothetical protein
MFISAEHIRINALTCVKLPMCCVRNNWPSDGVA